MLKKSRNPFPVPLEGEKQAEIGLEQASKRLKPGEIYIIYAGFPSKISVFPSSISGSPSKYIRISLRYIRPSPRLPGGTIPIYMVFRMPVGLQKNCGPVWTRS